MERKTWFRTVLNLNWVAPSATVSVTIFSLKSGIFILAWLHISASVWTVIRQLYKTIIIKVKFYIKYKLRLSELTNTNIG